MAKQFTSNSFNAIRNDINAALAAVGAKHGIEMSIDRITYTPSTFRTTLNAVLKDAVVPVIQEITGNTDIKNLSPQEVKWKSQFLADPTRFGMIATDFVSHLLFVVAVTS